MKHLILFTSLTLSLTPFLGHGQLSTPQPSTCSMFEDFNQPPNGWTIIDNSSGSISRLAFQFDSSGGYIKFNDTPTRDGDIRAFKPLAVSMCSTWTMSCEFTFNAIGTSDPYSGAGHFLMAMTYKNEPMIADVNSSLNDNDMVGMMAVGNTATGLGISMMVSINSQNYNYHLSPNGYLQFDSTYVGYVKRIDSNEFRISITRATQLDTVRDETVQIPNGLGNQFNYLQSGTTSISNAARRFTGTVDNMCVRTCGSSISVEEHTIAIADVVQVYPNPAHDYFSIEGLTQPGTMRLVDLTGRTVLQRAFAGEDELKVSVNNIPAGVYAIRLEFDSGALSTRKIVINR